MEYLRWKCSQAVQGFNRVKCARTGYHLKLPSPTKFARLGHYPPASQAGRLAGPVFYVYVFSLINSLLWDFVPKVNCRVTLFPLTRQALWPWRIRRRPPCSTYRSAWGAARRPGPSHSSGPPGEANHTVFREVWTSQDPLFAPIQILP